MFHGIVSVLKCDLHRKFLAYSKDRVEVVVNHFFFVGKTSLIIYRPTDACIGLQRIVGFKKSPSYRRFER